MKDQPDPLDHADRATLAGLAREYLLCGHLIDRAGMAYLIGPHQLEGMRDVAIDEWMGASPVYTRRMQRLLGFEGDTVATIFKGMQFDIGAPHEFLDFRYTLHDDHHGEFRLDHCGALADVEPMGEDFVIAMCHDIEDPTFDATAMATNSRAQVRPIHRPPRTPADRHPHCAWTVTIDDDHEPLVEPEVTTRIGATLAATLPLPSITTDPSEAGSADQGMGDYAGEFVDRIELEHFSAAALRAIIAEVCLQQHLLSMSFMVAVEDRWGRAEAVRVGTHQLIGIAGLTASRLADTLDRDALDRAALERVADVLDLHPLGRPHSYAGLQCQRRGDDLTVSFVPGPADDEQLPTWTALARNDDRVMQSIATCIDARAVCRRLDDTPTWSITLGDQPQAEPDEVAVVRISTGADWSFETPVKLTHR